MGIQFKKNEVKCDIGSYIHYWRGVKKSGKTTMFYDLVKEQYKDLNKGLLIAVGDEIGYQALDGLVYAEAPTWGDLIEVIDTLVEEKEDNEFEIVALDTVDEVIKLAKEEVKRLHKKTKGTAAEFNACFGGYGMPRDMVTTMVDEQIARIRRAGYGIVFIGHTKLRDVKEKNGDEYQQLTSNLNADFDSIFSNKADIVMTIVIEKDIDENKHIEGTTRYMYFRSDGFVDAGGRFSEMPQRVEYGAKNYLEAFEAGVKGAMSGKVSGKEIEKRKKTEKEERFKRGIEESKKAKEEHVDTQKNDELVEQIKTLYKAAEQETKDAVKEIMAEYEIESFKDVSETPTVALEKILSALS